jgi:hypothetical protein
MRRITLVVAACLILAVVSMPVWGQEILLDKVLKAGPLTVFRDFSDEKAYYYVPDKARLGAGPDGKPEFSFIKYVTNVSGKPGEAEAEEGEGGGIVHCLVQLGASDEQVEEARSELRRLAPGARLVGPIMFRSGKFAIVSQFKQEDGDLATKVLGMGNAPIHDGAKASVSIRLTKLGAKLLWQYFQMATPDISFHFEMELAGYRNPYEATLEANWDQVYNHRDFGMGFASTYLGFQIRDTFDELRDKGAIKLIVKGEDAKMDTLISMAYGKVCDAMFDKIATSAAGSGAESASLLDKAAEFLKSQRQQSRGTWNIDSLPSPMTLACLQPDWMLGEQRLIGAGSDQDESVQVAMIDPEASQKKEQSTSSSPSTSGQQGSQQQSTQGSTGPRRPPEGQSIKGRKPATEAPQGTTGQSTQGTTAGSGGQRTQRSEPSFSLLASYTMKKVKRSGVFTLSFKKYTSDIQPMPFDHNIGDLSKLMKDKKRFLEVNLDDPVFKQREVSVFLDGQNAADFANYVNYVTVRLRKVHEAGDQTNDEVRIDRANFNQNGNFFRLLYGWKNDKDRDRWMNYEYDTVWSFHGGKEVDIGWQKGNTFALTVTPPYLKRTIHLEADPAAIQEAEVRLITAKFFYNVAGAEQVKQVTLNPATGQLSQTLEYIRPANELKYDYELSWRLKGGRTVTSGRKSSTDDFIFCDELPARTPV